MGGGGLVGLYSLRCHLRKVLGPVKLSEWMECFFRRPRSTFFHCGTWVCLFLFQIHSIILNCSKHSSTFQKPRIPSSFFPHPSQDHQPPPPLPSFNTCPHSDFFFFPSPSFLIADGRGTKESLFFSLSKLRNLAYFRRRKALILQAHLAGTMCSYIIKMVKADMDLKRHSGLRKQL